MALGFGRTTLLSILVAAPLLTQSARPADACGGFFRPHVAVGPRRPSLSYEKTLVIFDQEKRREHFVREVVFRAAGERFGFVVPVPARPEVASMKSPFEGLEREFPFEVRPDAVTGARRGGSAPRSAPKSAGVTVLEVKKVGSFTAFVLAADDASALSDWLAKNGLVSTPEADRWLSHYVKMKFFYVAMRYDPPSGPSKGTTSAETMRISFDTPVAYYPYFEPDPPEGKAPEGPRMLELWLASSDEKIPIAARTEKGSVSFVRPMEGGRRFSVNAQPLLKRGFGAAVEFLPKGPVYIQRFIDQKRSRVGYGDVLFVPVTPTATSPEALRPLLAILDPSLAESTVPEGSGK